MLTCHQGGVGLPGLWHSVRSPKCVMTRLTRSILVFPHVSLSALSPLSPLSAPNRGPPSQQGPGAPLLSLSLSLPFFFSLFLFSPSPSFILILSSSSFGHKPSSSVDHCFFFASLFNFLISPFSHSLTLSLSVSLSLSLFLSLSLSSVRKTTDLSSTPTHHTRHLLFCFSLTG